MRRYVVRVSGDPTRPVEEQGFYPGACPFSAAPVFSEETVAGILRVARIHREPVAVWAIEVEVRVVDARPCFAVGADSGGG